VHRQLGAHLEDLERRVRAEDVVDDHHRGAVHHPDSHGGVRALRESLGVHYRAAAELVQVEVGVAELEQARSELVLVRVAVLLDEPVGEKRLEQAVDGGAGELEPVRELAHTQPPRSRREGLQNASSAVDGLDRAALGRTLTIRYCRIHFDSVD
jgi:hypothetical protein